MLITLALRTFRLVQAWHKDSKRKNARKGVILLSIYCYAEYVAALFDFHIWKAGVGVNGKL